MEKLYCDGILEGANDYTKELYLKLYNMEEEAHKSFEEEYYKSWVIEFHDFIRKELDFPNKLFGLLKIKDKEEVNVVMFPKEPNNDYYKICFDEEVMKPYILVNNSL